jgi:hypothetical protein
LIAVKDWAKPPSDHIDPYHLGIRFVGFLTVNLFLSFSLLKFALLPVEICETEYYFKSVLISVLVQREGVRKLHQIV